MNPAYDPWDDVNLSPEETINIYKNKPESERDPWDELDFGEGFWKNAFRTALQIPQGIAEATTYGIATGLWQLLASGDVLDPEEMERIRAISEREGIPFDEEAYMQAAQNALSSVPTVSNIAKGVEERTGLPLEPKTWYQKATRLGSTAAKFQPGTASEKAVAGIVAPTASQGLQAAGVPEPLADIAGLAGGAGAGAITPSADVSLAKTKPSGLTARQFEKVKTPKEISKSTLGKINKKLESDFRDISDNIIIQSPIQETRATLRDNPGFKNEVREQFKRVDELAEHLPERISTDPLKDKLSDALRKSEGTGISASEYQEDFQKFINEYIKKTSDKQVSAVNLVKQFRENNSSISEYYEPGRSKAYNRAKKDALLEYNRAIADVIEKQYPNTEFSQLFQETNKQWSKINDAESIDEFFNSLFNGKVNYKEAREFFNDKNLCRPFKKQLGEAGFKDFEQLMKDLLESETAYKMLKAAKSRGWSDLAKIAGGYILHPKIAVAQAGYSAVKKGYKSIMEALLDKPQLTFTWKEAVKDLKKGKFQEAQKGFEKLDNQVKSVSEQPQQVVQEQNISKIGEMGSGIVDSYYDGVLEALKNGKNNLSGVKDPFFDVAKVNFDRGLIKTIEDLKKLSKQYKKIKRK